MPQPTRTIDNQTAIYRKFTPGAEGAKGLADSPLDVASTPPAGRTLVPKLRSRSSVLSSGPSRPVRSLPGASEAAALILLGFTTASAAAFASSSLPEKAAQPEEVSLVRIQTSQVEM